MEKFCIVCHCARDGNFCRYCGTKLVDLLPECECGRLINPYDFYCIECGRGIPGGVAKPEMNRPDLLFVDGR